ncbi:hypothetical protein CYMTET_53647 [Cymbomonas tetramitiformis]|uniref:Uncharacterized protein n=1 Tax=Cymbomonas tetramitiformis TaxID=36881 RepID=A0AAE0BGS2_9CHLO|nr:hypothetical protein CYMTET_53647 [Cymbomonas tetramitiformis]
METEEEEEEAAEEEEFTPSIHSWEHLVELRRTALSWWWGLYGNQHTPGHAVWHPGPSQPRVVVPFVGPWWFAPGGPPSGAPPSPDYDPEEEEQPTLNGDHGSARNWGFYIDDRYGVDITAPLHRTDNHTIADFFTRPLPPQARFYDNPSLYGIEPNSEGSDTEVTDSGYGSGMDEVD